MEPRRDVLMAVALTAVIITVDEARQGEAPKPRHYVGLVAVWLVLTAIGTKLPRLASPFAWLLFLTVLMDRGIELFRWAGKFVMNPGEVGEVAPIDGGGGGGKSGGGKGRADKGDHGKVYKDGSPGIWRMIRASKKHFIKANPNMYPNVGSLYRPCAVTRSGGWSEHGWGRAVDLTCTINSRENLIALRMYFERRKAEFGIAYTLGPDNEPDDHHDHVHISEEFSKRGTKPPGC